MKIIENDKECSEAETRLKALWPKALPGTTELDEYEILEELILEYQETKGIPAAPANVSLTKAKVTFTPEARAKFEEDPKYSEAELWKRHDVDSLRHLIYLQAKKHSILVKPTIAAVGLEPNDLQARRTYKDPNKVDFLIKTFILDPVAFRKKVARCLELGHDRKDNRIPTSAYATKVK
jgi:hypothetical protein